MNPPAPIRSVKSARSNKSGIAESEEINVELLLTELFKKFYCPYPVALGKEYTQQGKGSRIRESKTEYKHLNFNPTAVPPGGSDSNELDDGEADIDAEKIIAITAIHDYSNRLTEIQIAKYREQPIPKIVMQLLGVVLSKYPKLNKLTIKNCRMNMIVIQELSKSLPLSTITELCLDGCPITMANYDLLLNYPLILKSLSLCRCQINDVVCEQITSKLFYLQSAEEHLSILNLSSNRIGDNGAKQFAEALKSNRHLRYLNLADNLITDVGADYIFNTLIQFKLTSDENMDRRNKYMLHLKKKLELYHGCLKKLGDLHKYSGSTKRQSIISTMKVPATSGKQKQNLKKEKARSASIHEENIPLKAELMANELVGPFEHPYCPSNMRVEDGDQHCIGNLMLCYLNLAYNNLTYTSVTKLLSVVEYQRINTKPNMPGIMKVVLDGNYLPENCVELVTISKILNKHVASFHEKDKSTSTKKGGLDRKNM